jgi:hypothetical protein
MLVLLFNTKLNKNWVYKLTENGQENLLELFFLILYCIYFIILMKAMMFYWIPINAKNNVRIGWFLNIYKQIMCWYSGRYD